MAGEWRDTILGDVIELKRGYDLPSRERKEGRFPIVSSSGISGYHVEAKVKAPGVVTGRYGTIGQVFYITTDFWPLNTALYVRDFKGNDPRFISYFLQTLNFLAYSDKAAVPGLNRNHLHSAPVRVPPLKQQQAIACILGALDDKIELNRRRNRTLEALARAIFQSWFVDFDPVKAKAAGNQPPGLKPELAALFPDSFEDSPLGPIPAGWRVGTVGDLADFNAWTLGKRDPIDEIDYIEISEVMRGEVGDIKRYSRGTEPGRARRRLRHGDTALSTVRPDRGAYFLSIDPPESFIASTGFAVLTAKQGCWAFVHVLTTRPEFGEELGRLADGGAYPAVRPEVIAARPAVVPASDVLEAFEKIAQPMFLRAEKARQEARALGALRDTLLPQLLSGELRVPDAERIVGRCV